MLTQRFLSCEQEPPEGLVLIVRLQTAETLLLLHLVSCTDYTNEI